MQSIIKSLLALFLLAQPWAAFGEHLVKGVVTGVQVFPDNLLIFTIVDGKPRCPRFREYYYNNKDASIVKSVLSFLMTSKISNIPVTLVMEDQITCAYHGVEGVTSVVFGDK